MARSWFASRSKSRSTFGRVSTSTSPDAMDAPSNPMTNAEPVESSPRSSARRGENAGAVARHRAMLYAILAQALAAPAEALCLALADDMFWATLQHALGGAPAAHRRHFD